MALENLGEHIRTMRKARNLSQEALARRADVSLNLVGKLELGMVTNPHYSTLAGLARALDVTVEELVEEPAPLDKASEMRPLQASQEELADTVDENEQPTREPQSPKLRRFAAQARRAELDHVLKHLTLRLEALRDQAKTHYEAGDAPEELWPLFMDSVTLARGAEGLLIDSREEAEELGGETEEERRLRGRLEHRTEDAEETREEIGDMWKELLDAKTEAENEALRKELQPDAEPLDLMPFLRKRAG